MIISQTSYILISIFLSYIHLSENKPLSVLIWHGMGDSGYNQGMKEIAKLIEENVPGIKTKQVTIGSNDIEDTEAGFFTPVHEQLQVICQEVLNDPDFSDGAQFLGLSQGALFIRALVQSCPIKGELGSLVSLGGPQQGIYGLPSCPGSVSFVICRLIDKMLSEGAYLSFIQSRLVQAQYWHDPLDEDKYIKDSQFLAQFNQLPDVNNTYIENMKKLKKLVLVQFDGDSVVVPKESEHFRYFEPKNLSYIYPLKESPLYKQDFLGLKTLDESNRLNLLNLPGDHLQFNKTWFIEKIVPFFGN